MILKDMALDLSLNEELRHAGEEELLDCLSVMQRYWAECAAPDTRKRREWAELLGDLKKLPLKFRTNELRKEIQSMWEKCLKSKLEKDNFVEFHSQEFSESLIVKHKEVLEKLEAYYVQHKELICLVAKYEEMWKSLESLQEQSHNPERLFKNRGAQLLKEECDRKLISRIPAMQNTIIKAIKKKEAEGTVFLIRGEHFSDIIARHNKKDKVAVKRTPMSNIQILGGPVSKRRQTELHGVTNGPLAAIPCSSRKAVRQLEMK